MQISMSDGLILRSGIIGCSPIYFSQYCQHIFKEFVQPVMWESLGSLALSVFFFFFARLVLCGSALSPSLLNPLQVGSALHCQNLSILRYEPTVVNTHKWYTGLHSMHVFITFIYFPSGKKIDLNALQSMLLQSITRFKCFKITGC